MERVAEIARKTKETDITCRLDLDNPSTVKISTGIGFFDHMLEAFARHGRFGLELTAMGDLHVDGHHTVEDCGIVLGQAFAQAIGDKRGIVRYGTFTVPMDESLIMASLDFSGRGGMYWEAQVPIQMVGEFDSTLAKEFFIAFATNANITLHIVRIAGDNAHHLIEAMFKAVGRALRQAVVIDPELAGELPSTKGVL